MTDPASTSRQSEPRYEYRVRWQRFGRARTGKIMQTERGALGKIRVLVDLEEDKHLSDETGYSRFDGMADLIELPTLERRAVGEWEPVEHDVELHREPDPDSEQKDDGVPYGPGHLDGEPF